MAVIGDYLTLQEVQSTEKAAQLSRCVNTETTAAFDEITK